MIRLATKDDLEALTEVRDKSIRRLAPAAYSQCQIDGWLSTTGSIFSKFGNPKNIIFVEEFEGNVIAFAQLDADTATVERMYVAPDFARQGIGARLIAQLEATAANLGIRTLRLDATLNGLPFYEASGYSTEQRYDDILPGGVKFPYVKMAKTLRAHFD